MAEFQELGFEILINFKEGFSETKFDKFLFDFIDEIERNKLLCGGGGNAKSYEIFVTSEKKFASPTLEQKENIRIWIENNCEVRNFEVGEFKHAWND